MTLRRLTALFVPLALAGCTLPETRLRSGLLDAGLSPRLSACMADRMAARLGPKQLSRLSYLPSARAAGDLSGFLRRVRALGDPDILAVTSGSAVACATGSG